jgi:hypothetical protein
MTNEAKAKNWDLIVRALQVQLFEDDGVTEDPEIRAAYDWALEQEKKAARAVYLDTTVALIAEKNNCTKAVAREALMNHLKGQN